MTPQADDLDRLIDALNAGDVSTVDHVADPELAALMAAVHRIRRLQEADWPEQTVRQLAQELGRSEGPDTVRDAVKPIPGERSGPVRLLPNQPRREAPTRRRFVRELAQMAAAILVLVLVGGGLAVIFRNQGQSQPGVIGSGATPTSSPGLPMTVSANGISVTVGLVDSTSSATRFYVDIALPPYDPGYYESDVLGQSPADNVQIDGMNARATDLQVSENSIGSTRSIVRLWLDYPAPFPASGIVTLTIKQLWLPAKPDRATPTPTDIAKETPVPITMAPVNGPWIFHLAATMFATQPLSTPLSGVDCFDVGLSSIPDIDCYSGVSANLAHRLVGFPVIEPTPLPASLIRDDFGVMVYRLGTTKDNRPNFVTLSYPLPSGQQSVNLVETTDHAAVPTVTGGTVSTDTILAPNGPAQTGAIRPGTLATMTIDGVTVTRFESEDTRSGGINFVWTRAGVSYNLSYTADPNPQVTNAELQQMVTSVIAQSDRRTPASEIPPVASP